MLGSYNFCTNSPKPRTSKLENLNENELYKYFLRKIEDTKLSQIYVYGRSAQQQDKQDIITTVKYNWETSSSPHFWYVLANSIIVWGINPSCRRVNKLNHNCGSDTRMSINATTQEKYTVAMRAVDSDGYSAPLAYLYAQGIHVQSDILRAFDLYYSDKNKGSEYYWADIN